MLNEITRIYTYECRCGCCFDDVMIFVLEVSEFVLKDALDLVGGDCMLRFDRVTLHLTIYCEEKGSINFQNYLENA